MIIDRLTNLIQYSNLLPHLTEAMNALQKLKDSWQEGQRYYFDGGFIFFQSGRTKPIETAQFEAHRQYVDVQVLLEGSEYLAWNELAQLEEISPYNADKDVQKFDGRNEHTMLITKGMAYIMFPSDGHKAVSHIDKSLEFTKAVIKLKIN